MMYGTRLTIEIEDITKKEKEAILHLISENFTDKDPRLNVWFELLRPE